MLLPFSQAHIFSRYMFFRVFHELIIATTLSFFRKSRCMIKIKKQNLIFCLFISLYYFNSIPINALVSIDILTRAFIREKIKVVAWYNDFKFCILNKICQISLYNWFQLSHPEFPKSVVKNLDRYKEKNDEKPVQLLYVVLQLARYYTTLSGRSGIQFCHLIYLYFLSFIFCCGQLWFCCCIVVVFYLEYMYISDGNDYPKPGFLFLFLPNFCHDL